MEGTGRLCSLRGFQDGFLARRLRLGVRAKEGPEGARAYGREPAPKRQSSIILRGLVAPQLEQRGEISSYILFVYCMGPSTKIITIFSYYGGP